MAINATSQPCRCCGIGPGRPHIDGCPLDKLLEAVTPRAGRASASPSTGARQVASLAPTVSSMPR
ncbi:hypothetical protein [Azospirillum sp. B506]|uniref:hypothetical protein n=1 Tax=Azospirillum sp. B506 TaxID=137721 RepID=UPI00034C0305|nr:hypothetical protein [Azospirillum sp. B506]